MKRKINEKRQYPRYQPGVPIKMGGAELDSVFTQTVNISEGGALCKVTCFVSPMTRMMITMVVPLHKKNGSLKDEVFKCEAIVVYTIPGKEKEGIDHYEIGLLFASLKDKDRKKIQLYIKQHLENLIV
ncbi:MAG: PilZ domain-containing protein [Candidatus Anammoxibacter sp.]